MPYEKADAIVIRHWDYSETSRIFVFYTREFGRLSALAKGAKRKYSKLIGHADLFSHCEIVLASHHDREGLHILTEASAAESFVGIRAELERFYAACHAVELVNLMTAEGDANPALFGRFIELLRRLARGLRRAGAQPATAGKHALPLRTTPSASKGGISPHVALFAFEAHLLVLTGFMPQLLNCVSCGARNRAKSIAFSQRLGGVICPRCSPRETDLIEGVPSGALGLLDRLASGKLTKLERVSISPQVAGQMRAFLNQYETHITGKRLRTIDHL